MGTSGRLDNAGQHIVSLEDELLTLKLLMQKDQMELQHQLDELRQQLSLLKAQKDASEAKLLQDVQQVTLLSEQAQEAAHQQATALITENTGLKTRHDEMKRLTEDLQSKLAEVINAKDELAAREKLRDMDQQNELDSATSQGLSAQQKAIQAAAQCKALEELCNDYKRQNEKQSIVAQTANDRVQEQARKISQLEESIYDYKRKLDLHEQHALSPRSKGADWFRGQAN